MDAYGRVVDTSLQSAIRTEMMLDPLGNRVGQGVIWGRVTTGPPDGKNVGSSLLRARTDAFAAVAAANGANTLHHNIEAVGQATPSTRMHSTDSTGAMTSDGEYVYEYDAFHRLVGVRLIGGASVNAAGVLAHRELMGCWIRAYRYDGLGRLVATLSPEFKPRGATASVSRIEQYLFDGDSRISTVIGDGSGSRPPTLDREYIWDPHVPDRLICQLDAARVPWVTLTDALGNPKALVNGQSGSVVEQYELDPFGECLGVETLTSECPLVPMLTIGHQGLFVDRLDAKAGAPVLAAGAKVLVHNRARDYVPSTGRFLQPDPNATGMALAAGDGSSKFGGPPPKLSARLEPGGQYGDGSNLYLRASGDPKSVTDPSGQFGVMDINFSASCAADLESGWAKDIAEEGMTIADSLGTIYGEYAADRFYDMQWATDWSEPDDLYRGSASWSSKTGSWVDEEASPEVEVGVDGPEMAGAVDPAKLAKVLKKMTTDATGAGVYAIYGEGDVLLYVGRSKDIARRMKQSQAAVGGIRSVGIELKGKGTIRALEDALIRGRDLTKYGMNKINGMSDKVRASKKGAGYYRELRKFLTMLK